MPSFDITSKANIENIKNAIDVSMRMVNNRYDFKGTSAKLELYEKDMKITLNGDSEFQINQLYNFRKTRKRKLLGAILCMDHFN